MSTMSSRSAMLPMDSGSLAKKPASENCHPPGVRNNCAYGVDTGSNVTEEGTG